MLHGNDLKKKKIFASYGLYFPHKILINTYGCFWFTRIWVWLKNTDGEDYYTSERVHIIHDFRHS